MRLSFFGGGNIEPLINVNNLRPAFQTKAEPVVCSNNVDTTDSAIDSLKRLGVGPLPLV